MADLPGGKILDTAQDPVTGKPIDTAERDDFKSYSACGRASDLLDLAIVLAHLEPLPHRAQNQTN
jgi:hypothetical protein